MHARILPAHQRVLALIALLLAPTIPFDSMYAPIPLVFAVLGYAWAQHNATRFERPELLIAGGLLFGQLMLVTAVVVDSRQHTVGLAILVWPLVAAGGRFPSRVVWAFTAFTIALMCFASLAFEGAVVLHDPILLTLPIATVLAVVLMSAVIRESDAQHRSAAILDGLTGMLNRTALAARTHEIEHQSTVTGHPVAVVVADVDHFKDVNDTHGHATGDHVLRDLAYVMRKELRAFDLAYRVGGEEFAIIMPGADEPTAAALAERLRAAIASEPISGLPITMSFGVSASPPGAFDWDDAYLRADAALYRAKQDGRDAVRCASHVAPVALAAAA
ncbi:GGDEF domain-containing protein [Baekduia sp. Peel2402]|uniref:GGDEF domain-containing protein n=1 Tax=Baekduia sp. Peel2402 TaxID=3458296 RepID=UPI00403EE469